VLLDCVIYCAFYSILFRGAVFFRSRCRSYSLLQFTVSVPRQCVLSYEWCDQSMWFRCVVRSWTVLVGVGPSLVADVWRAVADTGMLYGDCWCRPVSRPGTVCQSNPSSSGTKSSPVSCCISNDITWQIFLPLCSGWGYRSGSPTAIEAWRPCRLLEPCPSHPIVLL